MGENFCDNGFFKVEFGQTNIEKVFIAETYLNDNSEWKQINIYINEVSKDCKIKFSANEGMNDSFEMYYNQSEKDFYFQCGRNCWFKRKRMDLQF